jgi:riboflavin-specific deaminase-like protein
MHMIQKQSITKRSIAVQLVLVLYVCSCTTVSSAFVIQTTSSTLSLAMDSESFPLKQEQNDRIITGVTLKIAVDAAGAAADLSATQSKRFTCDASLDLVHRLRRDSDAVLIGRATVITDNPSLTVRRVECGTKPQPLRVVLDPSLALLQGQANSKDYVLFADGLPTVVYHCLRDGKERLFHLGESVTIVQVESEPPTQSERPCFDLRAVIHNLRDRFKVSHLMVEGGPQTARLFLQAKLIDRAILIRAPICFQEPLDSGITSALLEQAGLVFLGSQASGDDMVECWSRPGLPWPTEQLDAWP